MLLYDRITVSMAMRNERDRLEHKPVRKVVIRDDGNDIAEFYPRPQQGGCQANTKRTLKEQAADQLCYLRYKEHPIRFWTYQTCADELGTWQILIMHLCHPERTTRKLRWEGAPQL